MIEKQSELMMGDAGQRIKMTDDLALRNEFRSRMYQSYVHGRQRSIAPPSLEGLMPRAALFRGIIREHFPSDKNIRVVDLGCGHGAFLYFMREAGYQNVVGIDASPEQVAEAERLGIAGVEAGDLMEALATYSDASVDVVVAFDVIEHFRKEELLAFTDAVYRVLRPGGRWILHCPNGESPFAGRAFFGDITHEMAFTRTSMSQLLKATGFDSVLCQEDAPIPHGAKSALRCLLWKGVRRLLRFYLAVETGAGEAGCLFSQNFLTVATK